MVKNLTTGSPALLIMSFAIPLFIGNVFQQSYNMADAFIVGRTLGLNALAAVGCTGSLNFLIIGFLIGFCSGATVLTSQRFGAGDMSGVRRSFAAIIVISICVAIALTILSVVFVRPLLVLIRTPPEILEEAYSYIVIVFWGIPAAMLYNLLSSVMRALGDSRTPLVFLAIACVINIILDIVFILILHTDLRGVALATVIAQTISGLLCVPVIIRKFPILKITKEDWRFDHFEISKQLKLALPVGFQMSIIAIGSITVTFALNKLGTVALAAFTAALRIDMTAGMVLQSFGVAMTTYSAQNYGACKFDRIRQGIIQISFIACSYSIVMVLLFLFTGSFFPGLFLGKESVEALAMSSKYLIITSSFYILLAMLFIIRQSLLGLGDSFTPTIAGIMELVMRVFAAIFLGNVAGFTGICFANPLAWAGALIPLVISFVLHTKKFNIKKRG
jgi:putative MATE family efflux protein